MQTATIQLETLVCPTCAQKIEKATKALDGVDRDSVKVMFSASKVKFDFDETKVSLDDAVKAITALGFEVLKTQAKPKQ